MDKQKQIIRWLCSTDKETREMIIKYNPIRCFSDDKLRKIYEAQLKLVTGKEIDTDFDISLFCDIMGEDIWEALTEGKLRLYIEELLDKRGRNYARTQYLKLADLTGTKDLKVINKAARKIIENTASVVIEEDKKIADYLTEIENQGDQYGLLTGFDFIDDNTKGLYRGHFWVIGAYTNVGKTTLALQMAYNLGRQKESCLFVSTEMTSIDLVRKLKWIKDQTSGDDISQMDIKFVDKFFEYEDIERAIRLNKKPVVFIDFIQNIMTKHKTEYEKISNVSLSLQSLAKELDICIVATSQVSNEHAKSKSDIMGFKGSGTLSAACDVGIEITRNIKEETDFLKNGSSTIFVPAKIDIKKNRFGPKRFANIAYDPRVGIFYNKSICQ